MIKCGGIKKIVLLLILLAMMTGCGSGGDGIEGTGLKGTVAIGDPATNVAVTIKGRDGNKKTTSTDNNGKYDIALDGLTAPYIVQVKLNENKVLYSIATDQSIANVHPFSDVVSRHWFIINGLNIDNEFSNDNALSQSPEATQINAIIATLKQLLSVAYDKFSIANDFDFIRSDFNADKTGFDALLDQSVIQLIANNLTIQLKDPLTDIAGTIVAGFNLSNDIAATDNQAPSSPTGLTVLAASPSALVVVWNSSEDNIGVAGYNIYRDGEKLTVSPYPVLSDTGLTSGQAYCYVIEAIDAAQNVSQKTTQVCGKPLAEQDNDVPAAPSSLVLTATTDQGIDLFWQPSSATDVLGYHVWKNRAGINNVKIATVIASQFSDVNLQAETEYCYTVQAFDAAGNQSVLSNEACATSATKTTPDSTPPLTSATPRGGSYTSTQTISLHCDDGSGTGCAKIYYSTDGSEPNTNAATYTTPLTISVNSTVKFFAVDQAGNRESPVHSEVYTIDDSVGSNVASVQFSTATYHVNESVGAAEITVLRLGNSEQAASVQYTVEQGSAINGADYRQVSGSLSWEANDSANKVFYIPIKGDVLNESDETVLLHLSSPSDSLALGDIANATLSIGNVACDKTLSEDIKIDTVISEPCTQVTKNISITDNANLTINPGSTLIFESGTGFNVQSDGSLTANGTQAKPILLTAFDPTPGYWQGVQFTWSNSSRNSLEFVTIEFGGQGGNAEANLILFGGKSLLNRLRLKNCILTDSSGYGFAFSEGATLSEFSQNIITRNQAGAGLLPANSVRFLDADSRFSGNDKDFIEFHGSSQTLDQDQTWLTHDVPYLVDGLNVDANLQISAGAKLIFKDGGFINVDRAGSLKALGDEENKILFSSTSQSPGAWGGIQFTFSNDINNELDHVIVEYGGGPGMNGEANVISYGGIGLPQRLKMTNSILRYSASHGFDFSPGADISGFANNIMLDNEGHPGRASITTVQYLDPASDYLGNNKPYLKIVGGNVTEEQIWQKLNVDYSVGDMDIDANLTLLAGMRLVFDVNSHVNVSDSGSLTAVGTSTEKIIFTSDTESAGAWSGIQFTFSDNASNQLIHTQVDYAGGSGGNAQASVVLYGSNSLASQVEIRDSLIRYSETYPIWLAKDSKINADVDTANLFEDNANNAVFRAE